MVAAPTSMIKSITAVQPNTFVTWKDLSGFAERLGKVEGKTNLLVGLALTNLAANAALILALCLGILK